MASSSESFSRIGSIGASPESKGCISWRLITLASFLALSPFAVAESCHPGYQVVSLSPFDSGAKVNGPVCVTVPVNGLRYSAFLGLQTTVTTLDLSTAGVPPGALVEPAAGDNTAVTLGKMEAVMNATKPHLDELALANESTAAAVNKAVADITTVVSMSDAVFQQSDGTAALLKEIEAVKGKLPSVRDAKFQTTVEFYKKLTNVQNELLKIQLSEPTIKDPLKTQLTNDMTAVASMITAAAAYLPNADKTVAYLKQRQIFQLWDDRITHLSVVDFSVQRNVPCRTIGNETKKIDIVLNRTDLYPTLSGSAPTVVTAASPIVSVSCPSAFSLSGGLDMSFLKTYNYGLIPAATAGTFTYGVIKTTNLSAMPIAMVHARLMESPGHLVGLQLGFGAAAHTQDDSAGGKGAEYLLGLGVSLFRTINITPGWQIGRTAALTPGYKLGDTVASGVTAAPLVDGYSSGFGLALTFTKP